MTPFRQRTQIWFPVTGQLLALHVPSKDEHTVTEHLRARYTGQASPAIIHVREKRPTLGSAICVWKTRVDREQLVGDRKLHTIASIAAGVRRRCCVGVVWVAKDAPGYGVLQIDWMQRSLILATSHQVHRRCMPYTRRKRRRFRG